MPTKRLPSMSKREHFKGAWFCSPLSSLWPSGSSQVYDRATYFGRSAKKNVSILQYVGPPTSTSASRSIFRRRSDLGPGSGLYLKPTSERSIIYDEGARTSI